MFSLSTLKIILILVLLLLTFFGLVHNDDNKYNFDVKIMTHIERWDASHLYPYMKKLNPDELKELCAAAIGAASLEKNQFGDSSFRYYAYEYSATYVYPDFQILGFVGLKCNTVPESYVRFKNSEKDVEILIWENDFIDRKFTFDIELAKHRPIPAAFADMVYDRDVWEQKFKKNPLKNITERVAQLLCVAAKKRTQHLVQTVPTFLHSIVGEPQVYTVELSDERRKQIAIQCPTSPVLFVTFGGSYYHITVIFSESDGQSLVPDEGVAPQNNDIPEAQNRNGHQEIHSPRITDNANVDVEYEIEFFGHASRDPNSYPSGNFAYNPGFDLYEITEEERENKCKLAMMRASIDRADSRLYSIEPEVFKIRYPDQRSIRVIVVACRSIPKSYLRLGNSEKQIMIMLPENRFTDDKVYKFILKYINSRPTPAPPPSVFNKKSEQKKLENCPLSSFEDEDRLHICIAAKQFISLHKPPGMPEVVIKELYVGKPRKLQINFLAGKERPITIECPSTPTIYVYVGKSDHHFTVVLLENEPHDTV